MILAFGENSAKTRVRLFFVSAYYMYYFYAPIDPCLEVNCGKHSKCQVEGTEAFCVCDEGWTYNPKEISAGCVGKLILNRIWCICRRPTSATSRIVT